MNLFRRTAVAFVFGAGFALSCLADGAAKTADSSIPHASHAAVARETVFLPPLSQEVLEGLKAQDAQEAARRLQVGVGRAFDQAITVNRGSRSSQWTPMANGG